MSRRLIAGGAALSAGLVLLVGCSSSAPEQGGGDTPSPSTSVTGGATTPIPIEPSNPPLQPGRSRGHMLFVQSAEDASLVSGDRPIRLTLARTGNSIAWFAAPPQRRAGEMTTYEALMTLGWRPAPDGTTSTLPKPRPNGFLSYAGGSLTFTVFAANVRADGTLVLDITPMGPMPETSASLGVATLTLDGAPGVLTIDDTIGAGGPVDTGITVNVVISGERNQQAVVQLFDAEGEVAESRYVSRDIPAAADMADIVTPTATLSDILIAFEAPTPESEGRVLIGGVLRIGETEMPIEQVVARWSLPEDSAPPDS
ncbi:MAG: hypothetical protein VW362_02870 [Candidatus Nanopelagicales bacterium]